MSASKKQILVVEDEKIVALDIKGMLSRLGFDVLDIVSTGEKAIQMVTNKKPDLILMDIMLKGELDGINAAQHIIKHYNIPIIFLTAHSDQETKQRACTVNPHGYLLKPFNEKQLNHTIKTALKIS